MNKYKTILLITLILILGFFTYKVYATTFEDFESYSTGQLSGQGSWTGDTNIVVTTTVAQGGTKSVTRAFGGGSGDTTKALSPSLTTDTSTFSFYVRNAVTNDAGNGASQNVHFYDGATKIFTMRLSQDQNKLLLDGVSSQTALNAPSPDTWYQMEIEFDFTNDTARARVDGGTWTSSIAAIGSVSFTKVDSVAVQWGGMTAGAGYFDTFAYTAATVASTPPKTTIKRGSITTIKRGSIINIRK